VGIKRLFFICTANCLVTVLIELCWLVCAEQLTHPVVKDKYIFELLDAQQRTHCIMKHKYVFEVLYAQQRIHCVMKDKYIFELLYA
jgi:hypothetical protein